MTAGSPSQGFSLTVRDRVMIAHSFRGEVFGPAQRLHGATYVVEASFARPDLDAHGLVVDIGLAHDALKAVLSPLAFQNLDELQIFEGQNTTTEVLSRFIWQGLRDRLLAGELGPASRGITGLTVTLRESDVAWASFSGPVSAA